MLQETGPNGQKHQMKQWHHRWPQNNGTYHPIRPMAEEAPICNQGSKRKHREELKETPSTLTHGK